MADEDKKNGKKDAPIVDPLKKAAILMMSLDSKESAKVFKHLDPKQVQKLGIAMSTLENIDRGTRDNVFTDFLYEAEMQTGIGVEKEDYIRNVLMDALGEDKAGGVIDRIIQGGNTKGLDTLKWMDSRAVADLIRMEHPQIQTIVLSYLDADQSAEVLAFFDEKTRLDLILRISTMDTVQPQALQELNYVMEKQFSGKTGGTSRGIGGLKPAAEVMNNLDSSIEAKLMEDLKERDADLAQRIQDLMFVFDNLIDVDDRGIQLLLREVSTDVLVLALKGADTLLKEKIFNNMSKRAAELLRDDLDAKGPVRLSEVEVAQKEILGIARRMADNGEIMLGGKGGEEML